MYLLNSEGVICILIPNYSCTLNYEQNFFSITSMNEKKISLR